MATRNLANVTDRTRVSGEDAPWEEDVEVSFEDAPQSSTRVGMLPPGVGVKGRLSWLSSRWVRWTKNHAKRIGACLAILVIAGATWAVGAEAVRDAYRSFTAGKTTTAKAKPKPTPVLAKARVKSSATPKRAGTKKTVIRSASPKPAANDWKPVSAAQPQTTPGTDLVSAGHIYLRAGRLSAAEGAYRDALRQNKNDGEARFWLATAESSQGKKWRACRQFRKYLDDFPDGPHAHDARANVAACD